MPVDEIAVTRLGGEFGGRIALRRSALERTAFRPPLVQSAVEDCDTVEAERLQHPPEPRRPLWRADRIEHDEAVVADAMTAECRLELLGCGHHEAKRRAGIGELALQI